jgi:subtilisin family serine protease
VRAAILPDDPALADSQWNLLKVDAPSAWNLTGGSASMVIAIIDSGIDAGHPDLGSRLWCNAGEVPDNGLDDDQNGYTDDSCGWNFLTDSPDAADDFWHGTHVAGIIGAATDNSIGIAGITWQPRLMALKFLDSTGTGDFVSMLEAMRYAAANGARIINLSVSVSAEMSPEGFQLLDETMDYVTQKGVLVVAAAGNQGLDGVTYPAAHPDVMAVGASTAQDERWPSSNYGEKLDLVAPGVGIFSTAWTPEGAAYWSASGTSMATAHVSGAAALVWSIDPQLTPAQLRRILNLSSDDVNAATEYGRDLQLGWGRLNVGCAVRLTATEASERTYLPLVGLLWHEVP